MKNLSHRAKELLLRESTNLTIREEWAFELLRSMVQEPDVFQLISEEMEQEMENKLAERAVRMADLLAEKLTEGEEAS